ncbi:translation initiation factor IF-2 [Raineya orbicola]|uniref:Translation initiation factor IF-2 n=1 Tax=Raineya orbicola TaxID=2016530 RepID=A0A2N3II80_9BACT|nr:translation initiation factor IF-2 [Raineya orbicola]PKQ69958.1 IF-2: translation initiation factor IF-2 [Raineya orbicola]
MSEEKTMRLSQAARQFNVATEKIVETLKNKGFGGDYNPNSKLGNKEIEVLEKEFRGSFLEKKEAEHIASMTKTLESKIKKQQQAEKEKTKEATTPLFSTETTTKKETGSKVVETIATEQTTLTPTHQEEKLVEVPLTENKIESNEMPKNEPKIGLTVVGKIDLDAHKKNKTDKQKDEKKDKKEQKKQPEKNFKKQENQKKQEKENKVEKEKQEEKQLKPLEQKVQEQKKEEPTTITQEIPKVEPQTEIIEKTTQEPEIEVIKAKADTLKGLTVLDKIELPVEKPFKKNKPLASTDEAKEEKKKKKKRKRIKKEKLDVKVAVQEPKKELKDKELKDKSIKEKDKKKPRFEKEEVSEKEIQEQIKATLARMGGGQKKKSIKKVLKKERENETELQEQSNHLRVTEFISAMDLANLMNVSINELISKCMALGMFVSINQRLDAEAITIIADEFGYTVEFISAEEEIEAALEEEEDAPEDLLPRPPIVTVMGHVDHGKTSLLDYIRKTNIVAKESGGITQHIGAYSVTTKDNRKITFLDTPGHEAFTAMRARGAKLTDVAIIVIAADDNVMPQTKEAINHAQLAGVPIVFAISKIDKPTANPDKIREQLAAENILVEEWGGKYQCQEISSKSGQGIDELLEKVLLEAEILDLKANPNKKASGTVIEATLDKGRGYVSNLLVQTGTLKVGDIILVGALYGRVKAMTDHIGKAIKQAGPSTPVQILGLSGAPQAGDKFQVMESEREAKEIANKREQILREQSIRATKRLTLSDIGRRIALGNFQQLNIIIKGDVDGSVEALSDSLLKLSTEEIQVNVIHKAVGQITETDVNLAAVSDAVIIGFQVRPSAGAKKLAEQEQVEIRLYSIIYDAINEVKDAMEGMLAPTIEEVTVGNVEVREIFHIKKVGTIAGCMVTDGMIKRQSKIRVIRDGIVIHTGELDSLKRFKDDVSEVKAGYDCGLSIRGFNDIQKGDVIEVFEQREVKRKL